MWYRKLPEHCDLFVLRLCEDWVFCWKYHSERNKRFVFTVILTVLSELTGQCSFWCPPFQSFSCWNPGSSVLGIALHSVGQSLVQVACEKTVLLEFGQWLESVFSPIITYYVFLFILNVVKHVLCWTHNYTRIDVFDETIMESKDMYSKHIYMVMFLSFWTGLGKHCRPRSDCF